MAVTKQKLARIKELGEIIGPEEFVKRIDKVPYAASGDGHSFDDAIEYEERNILGYRHRHPKKERQRARRELESYTQDENLKVKRVAENELWRANFRAEKLRKEKVGKVKGCAILACFLAFFIGVPLSCYFEEKRKKEDITIMRLEMFFERGGPRSILNKGFVELQKEKIKKALEEGSMNPEHRHYQRYRDIFGNEDWWKEY
jgi:hypothetical protein